MKKLLFLLTILISFQTNHLKSQVTLTQLSFVPAQNISSIVCLNKDTVLAVGDSGYIVRTTNAGANWTSVTSNTNNNLYRISFVNATIGYAVGANGTILKTTDNGQNCLNLGFNSYLNLTSISFINKDTGWVAGGNMIDPHFDPLGTTGILMKTTDGGTNWNVDSTQKAISSVCFIDNDTGYISSNYETGFITHSYLKKTTDGGNSFVLIKDDSANILGYFTDIQFLNHKTGYFVYSGHYADYGVFQTTDYGNTWTNIYSSQSIRSLFVTDTCYFYIAVADMPGCGFIGINNCTTSFNNFGVGNATASFIKRNIGFVASEPYYCSAPNHIYKLDSLLTGITEKEISNIESFPNPFSSSTTILTTNTLKDATLTLYNYYGQQVKQIKDISGQTITLQRGNLLSGIYFMQLTQDNKTITTGKLLVTDN